MITLEGKYIMASYFKHKKDSGEEALLLNDYIMNEEQLLSIPPEPNNIFITYKVSPVPNDDLIDSLRFLSNLGVGALLTKATISEPGKMTGDTLINWVLPISDLMEDMNLMARHIFTDDFQNKQFFITEHAWNYTYDEVVKEIELLKNNDSKVSLGSFN